MIEPFYHFDKLEELQDALATMEVSYAAMETQLDRERAMRIKAENELDHRTTQLNQERALRIKAEEEVAALQALIAKHDAKTVCECPECCSDEFETHKPECPWWLAASAHWTRLLVEDSSY